MESLLSLSFDNISSKDPLKIRKGLRQIEGLLAQICLSKGSTSTAPPPPPQSPTKRQTGLLQQQHERRNEDDAKKGLEALAQDLAFREFWRLQENFEWNGALLLSLHKKNEQSKIKHCVYTMMNLGLTSVQSGDTSRRNPRPPARHA